MTPRARRRRFGWACSACWQSSRLGSSTCSTLRYKWAQRPWPSPSTSRLWRCSFPSSGASSSTSGARLDDSPSPSSGVRARLTPHASRPQTSDHASRVGRGLPRPRGRRAHHTLTVHCTLVVFARAYRSTLCNWPQRARRWALWPRERHVGGKHREPDCYDANDGRKSRAERHRRPRGLVGGRRTHAYR